MPAELNIADVCETILSVPANIAVFDVEPDDRFVIRAISPGLASLYGIKPDEVIGLDVSEFKYEVKTRRRLRDAYIKSRDTAAQVTLEEELPNPDGSRFWTSRTIIPLAAANGEIVALISTVIDITELVTSRKALVRTLSAAASDFVMICAWCRNVKDDQTWTPLDQYVKKHSESDVVLCPECKAAGIS